MDYKMVSPRKAMAMGEGKVESAPYPGRAGARHIADAEATAGSTGESGRATGPGVKGSPYNRQAAPDHGKAGDHFDRG